LEIRVLHRHGKGIREIARETGARATRLDAICVTKFNPALYKSRFLASIESASVEIAHGHVLTFR
jgi:hypothetical protein